MASSIHWQSNCNDGDSISSEAMDTEPDTDPECRTGKAMQLDGPDYSGQSSQGES